MNKNLFKMAKKSTSFINGMRHIKNIKVNFTFSIKISSNRNVSSNSSIIKWAWNDTKIKDINNKDQVVSTIFRNNKLNDMIEKK